MVRLTKPLPMQLSTGRVKSRSPARHHSTTQGIRLPPPSSLLASSSSAACVTLPVRRLQARQLRARQPCLKRRLTRVKNAGTRARVTGCDQLLPRGVESSTCLCRHIEACDGHDFACIRELQPVSLATIRPPSARRELCFPNPELIQIYFEVGADALDTRITGDRIR